MMRKYISVLEVLSMVRGIEALIEEDDTDFLRKRYVKIKNIYNESKTFGGVPKKYYNIIQNIDDEILKYIGVG